MPTWKSRRLVAFWLQVALVALATNSSFHKDLLSTVKSWPRVIYSALPVISAIEPQLNTSSMTDALKEVCQKNMYMHSHIFEPLDTTSFLYFLIISIINMYMHSFSLSGTRRVVCDRWAISESFFNLC